VLGELLAGLILGPTVLNFLDLPFLDNAHLPEMITNLSEIGVLLLMFVAGLELHFDELLRNSKVSSLAGVLGVFLPVVGGLLIGLGFHLSMEKAIFLGLTLGATSVSISAQTLMELNVLRSRVGLGLLGAAVFDDVLVILLLSVFFALLGGGGGFLAVLWLFTKMLLFFLGSVAFGYLLLPWIVRRVARLPISQGVIALGLVVMFSFGLAAELIGSIAAITGAFLAGLMFSRSSERERLQRGMSTLAYSFFVPVFFVNVGLSVKIHFAGLESIGLFLAILTVAILGKLVGCGLGARLAGFQWREAGQLGAGMISRGEVGLILATVGIDNGIMDTQLFSFVIEMVIITTLLTPPLLRYLYRQNKSIRDEVAQ
jgi:Kef-type K+ transport system membrane component KefB